MTETAAEADVDESLDAYIDAVQDRINVDLHENGFLSQNIPGTAEARAFLERRWDDGVPVYEAYANTLLSPADPCRRSTGVAFSHRQPRPHARRPAMAYRAGGVRGCRRRGAERRQQ